MAKVKVKVVKVMVMVKVRVRVMVKVMVKAEVKWQNWIKESHLRLKANIGAFVTRGL